VLGGYSWRVVLSAILLGGLVAISDELYQSTVPGRHANPLDAVADVVGVALAAIVWWRLSLLRKRLAGRPRQ
jgi:VanZ family protein